MIDSTFLVRLFSKEIFKYCHNSAIVYVIIVGQKLEHFIISLLLQKDIYLEVGLVVHYEQGNPYNKGQVIIKIVLNWLCPFVYFEFSLKVNIFLKPFISDLVRCSCM